MKHYFEVLKEGLSICVDTDIHYHYEFRVGEIIDINMYSDKASDENGISYSSLYQMLTGIIKNKTNLRYE